jgi:hypothetical protein
MKKTTTPSLIGYLWKNIKSIFAPSVGQIRNGFIGLLAFIALDLGTRDWHQVMINVAPTDKSVSLVTQYANGASVQAGTLTIERPNLVTLLFARPSAGRVPLFTLLMMIAAIVVVLTSPKLPDDHLFRKDISRSIILIGRLVLLHWLVTTYGESGVNTVVRSITNDQYKTARDFNILNFAQLYIGLVIMVAGRWYQKGVSMRKEQDLTI